MFPKLDHNTQKLLHFSAVSGAVCLIPTVEHRLWTIPKRLRVSCLCAHTLCTYDYVRTSF
jgi:hypothetical protein